MKERGDNPFIDIPQMAFVVTTGDIGPELVGMSTIVRRNASAGTFTDTGVEREILNPSEAETVPSGVRCLVVRMGGEWVIIAVYGCG